MNIQELNDLDLDNIGDWPAAIKFLLVLILCIGVGVGWYYFNTEDQLLSLEKVEKKELVLRKEFERKQAKAVNLERYKKQLEEMHESFGAMLRQLPNKTEIADLLVDVSQTGLAAGLEFELFDPQAEIQKEFYAEFPIKMRVVGNYHEFGEFVSGIAALPRIVTIHDVKIKPRGSGDNAVLVLESTAKTYRYIDGEGGQ